MQRAEFCLCWQLCVNIFTILRSEQVEFWGVQASQYIVIGTVALPCRLIIDFLLDSNFFTVILPDHKMYNNYVKLSKFFTKCNDGKIFKIQLVKWWVILADSIKGGMRQEIIFKPDSYSRLFFLLLYARQLWGLLLFLSSDYYIRMTANWHVAHSTLLIGHCKLNFKVTPWKQFNLFY